MKIWTVYKTTNLLNGRYYIGVHATCNENDKYYGSGKIIKAIIKKHGAFKLTKEILFKFDSEDLAYSKERDLLVGILGVDPLCMNIGEGGKKPPSHKGRKLRIEEIEGRRLRALGNKYSLGKKHRKGALTGKIITAAVIEARKKTKLALKGRKPSPQTLEAWRKSDRSWMKTPEYRQKMSAAVSKAKMGKKRGPLSVQWKENLSKSLKKRYGSAP